MQFEYVGATFFSAGIMHGVAPRLPLGSCCRASRERLGNKVGLYSVLHATQYTTIQRLLFSTGLGKSPRFSDAAKTPLAS